MDTVADLLRRAFGYEKQTPDERRETLDRWSRADERAQRTALGIYTSRRRTAEEKELGL